MYTKYTVEPNSKLNVGDIVTVTAEYDKDELIKNGYIAENDTKQYEVTNVAHYASELSEISDEYLEKMKKQTEDVIQAVTALWADANKYVSCEFLGNYFLTAKTEDLYSENNICYCIYKINGTTNGEEFSFYYYVSFKDIVILSDGTVSVDIMNYTKPKGSGFFNSVSGEAFILGNYWYIGYTDLDSMFNYCVTQKMEDYQYENTVMDN